MSTAKFSLLLITPIPVCRVNGGFRTLDLWVRDLAAQARVVERLCLLAPGGRAASPADLPVPEGIRVLTHADVAAAGGIDALVREHDVVQINSGMPWKTARWMFRGARAARKNDRCLVLGVSSNRATTTVMNAQRGSWLRRVKARLISRQILDVQTRLAKLADGVYLVGHGLALVSPHANTHIGTASWITAADVIAAADLGRRMEDRLRAPFLKLCVAGRLEFMKGTHLAIEALRRLRDRGDGRCPRLTILGEGPERAALQELVDGHGLADRVTFGGTFEYPTAFHRELGRHDLLLLTNLNDEQPRVVFDAASQGVLPVCPDTAPYRALGVDADLRYERGSDAALAAVIARLSDGEALRKAGATLLPLAHSHTIESMHEARAAWIAGFAGAGGLGRPPARPPRNGVA